MTTVMTKMTMISHVYWPHVSILHDVPTDHGIRVMPFLLAILWAYGNCNMRLGEYGGGWNWSIRRRCSMHRLCRRLQARCWWWWSWWRWRWWIRWPALLSSSALSEIVHHIENSARHRKSKIDKSKTNEDWTIGQFNIIIIMFQAIAWHPDCTPVDCLHLSWNLHGDGIWMTIVGHRPMWIVNCDCWT